jgi:hypothetical protein
MSSRQSTFLGELGSASKAASSFMPRLDARGRAVAAMLAAMTGETSLLDLSRAIYAAHPGAFASAEEALEEARRLAKKFG